MAMVWKFAPCCWFWISQKDKQGNLSKSSTSKASGLELLHMTEGIILATFEFIMCKSFLVSGNLDEAKMNEKKTRKTVYLFHARKPKSNLKKKRTLAIKQNIVLLCHGYFCYIHIIPLRSYQ